MSSLSPAEQSDGIVDLADTFNLINSVKCSVSGGAGDDTFTLNSNCSEGILYGDNGADTFTGSSSTFALGQIWGGNDTGQTIVSASGSWDGAVISGGPGFDIFDCRSASGDISMFGGAGDDNLYGGTGNDYLYGGDGRDWMEGGAGDDTFYAVDGTRDVIFGQTHILGDTAYYDVTGEQAVDGIEFRNPRPLGPPM